jgi:hypothetical protein
VKADRGREALRLSLPLLQTNDGCAHEASSPLYHGIAHHKLFTAATHDSLQEQQVAETVRVCGRAAGTAALTLLSVALMSAPRSSSSTTVVSLPLRAARCSGVALCTQSQHHSGSASPCDTGMRQVTCRASSETQQYTPAYMWPVLDIRHSIGAAGLQQRIRPHLPAGTHQASITEHHHHPEHTLVSIKSVQSVPYACPTQVITNRNCAQA